MFSSEIEALMKKVNVVILNIMCSLQKDYCGVFTVVYNQEHEELRMEEMDKEKIDREVKE
jgi:hypothetical protein